MGKYPAGRRASCEVVSLKYIMGLGLGFRV